MKNFSCIFSREQASGAQAAREGLARELLCREELPTECRLDPELVSRCRNTVRPDRGPHSRSTENHNQIASILEQRSIWMYEVLSIGTAVLLESKRLRILESGFVVRYLQSL